jgi:hypothetical protein
MQALKFKVLSKYRDFSRMHFGHRWLKHFKCVNEFSKLCHTFFVWSFISGCGAYQWFSSLGGHLGYFGHVVLICNSLTFYFHTDNTSFFFLSISFGEFQQKNYACMWRHYGFKIMEIFLRPLNKAMWNDFPPIAKEMHPFFEGLAITNAQVYMHLWWTSILTHPLNLSWRMTIICGGKEWNHIDMYTKSQKGIKMRM